ncbi:LysR family transcriptional regulator [Pseudoduganella eburnea]|uniref:LysR family transcriptional regulator n=1 Tax=Massilia eburnea TaxID=1776165 RepID=A0A6L6QQ86_9BURK|nr:LysR family transcriptional regulator [Massilia eburnea]MTW14261.1 LysR family transcriptional regulator [Massilia eburnea]
MEILDETTFSGLRVLMAVVDAGSFARAADLLDISPSAVSRAVSRLEARLGVRLFERTTRSLALSEEGLRFQRQVAPLLEGLQQATADAASGAGTVRGRLRVDADPLFAALVLGSGLARFLAAHPALQVELLRREQPGDLAADGCDLSLRFGQPRSSSMVARKLMETRILTVAAPAYLRRQGRPAAPQELARHQCIQFRNPHDGLPFPWEFHRGRKKLTVATSGQLMVNDAATLHSTCLGGAGIAQIIELGAERWLADGKLVELFPEWADERFPLYALYPSRRLLPPKTQALLQFVTDEINRHRGK